MSEALPTPSRPPGDRSFELALRLLTILVWVALAGSVGLLVYRFAPNFQRDASGPLTTVAPQAAPEPAKPAAAPARGDQVLMDPGRVFRCEEHGRVSFSDQACADDSGGRGRAAPGTAPAAH